MPDFIRHMWTETPVNELGAHVTITDMPIASIHVVAEPVWLTVSNDLLALDGRSLLICGLDGCECPMYVSIKKGCYNTDQIAVCVWQSNLVASAPGRGKPRGALPTKVGKGWCAYLDHQAVSQIAEAQEYCDLVLRLTE